MCELYDACSSSNNNNFLKMDKPNHCCQFNAGITATNDRKYRGRLVKHRPRTLNSETH